jgi:fucose 4-O-acetylase-like acetyltransferase
MDTTIKQRVSWVDQLKGFGIILVVYGHNLPIIEPYIYSFHMPLFFFLAGLFHPKEISFKTVLKRGKQILIPYFVWSLLLFIFWFIIGRNYGDSATMNLSVIKNFIGVFYAQGQHEYMNWGLPMWFLPAIFFSFLFFGFVRKIKNKVFEFILLFFLISIGFLIPILFKIHIIYSLDIALVSLFFYGIAFYSKDFWFRKKMNFEKYILLILFVFHIILSISINVKIDMYRSKYGNEFLFLLNAIIGVCFWTLVFKNIIRLRILSFFGKNTIPILALHTRALTVIKFILIYIFSITTFNFNEFEKLVLVFIQLLLIYPVILLVNKYIPILNGKIKTRT